MEAEERRISKAKEREGESGQWWPCDRPSRILPEDTSGQRIPDDWLLAISGATIPAPDLDERIMTKAWVE
jgi:hypothetical protein